ncbi:extracellular tyrosine-protein kinase PKDCC-like [Tubulanus polymorphus]|uniref:extracellular tyrosine-protein kinase PKDCC-like n=1 Tax=Tubulanus polymorphus TaxID=672921 RepID=UPI003DA1D5DA
MAQMRRSSTIPRLSLILYWLCAVSACVFICGNVLLLSPAFKPGDASLDPALVNINDGNLYHRLRRLMDISADQLHPNFSLSTVPTGGANLLPRMLDCDDLKDIRNRTFVASGWTKAVYKAKYNGHDVAVKLVDVSGHDMLTCMQNGKIAYFECYARAAQKIIKEILLLQGLAHRNVLQVYGFCVPNGLQDGVAEHPVAMVSELGESVDIIKLLQLSWEDRLRVCMGLTKLIHYLSHSPYGSLSMNDFRRQQFILAKDGEIKLTDLDDIGFEEPRCETNYDCQTHFSSANFTLRVPCVDNRCQGFNEKKNIFNAARHFTTFLLPHGAPRILRPMTDDIVNSYSNVTVDSAVLLAKMENIVRLYQKGWHLNKSKLYRSKTEYVKFEKSDFPGLFDYRCRFSLSGNGCTVSVFDQREAEDICNLDNNCQGFVVSSKKTWTGRKIIHLKNGAGRISKDASLTLFLKPGIKVRRHSR